MFSWFKSEPKKKLQKQYQSIYEKAIAEQRRGNIRGYSELIAESEKIAKQIEHLERDAKKN